MLRPTLRSRRLLSIAAAGALAGHISAADNHDIIGLVEEQSPFLMYVDADAVRASFAAQKPFSLLSDPRAADAVAHIREQLTLLAASDSDVPPLVAIIDDAKAAAFSSREPTDLGMPDLAFAANLGDAHAAVWQWLVAFNRGNQVQNDQGWEYFEDREDGTMVRLGTDSNQRLLIAPSAMWPGLLANQTPTEPPQAVAMSMLDMRPLLASLVRLAEYEGGDAMLDGMLPGWRAANLQGRAGIFVQSDGSLQGIVQVNGLESLPLRNLSVDPAVIGDGAQVVIGLANLDSETLIGRFQALFGDELMAQVASEMGTSWADLQALSGDLLLAVRWTEGPIPAVTLVNVASDTSALPALIEQASADVGAPFAPTQLEGATQAWQMSTPIGLILIGVAGDRVVIGNQLEAVQSALSVAFREPAQPVMMSATIDWPDLGQRFLPLVWEQAAHLNETLSRDPLAMAGWDLWEIHDHAHSMAQRDPNAAKPTTVAGLLTQAGAGDNIVALMPGADTAAKTAALDTHVQVWQVAEGGDPHLPPALVMRDNTGYIIVSDVIGNPARGLSPEQIPEMLDGMVHRLGPSLADLQSITLPPMATISSQWLPPLEAVIDHLPEWSLTITQDSGLIQAEELGMPVFTTVAGIAAIGGLALNGEVNDELADARRRDMQRTLANEDPAFMAAAEQLGMILERARSEGDLPAQPSDLALADGELEALSPLLASGTLTNAVQLNQLGLWQPGNWRQTWVLRYDDQRAVYLHEWGSYEVDLHGDLDLPARLSLNPGATVP